MRRFQWTMTLGSPWVLGILLGILFFTRSYFAIDPDFGWHLMAGRYIIAHGIPSHDIFTFSAAQFPWIDHEWLADVILAGVYQIGGYALLAGGYAFLWWGAFKLVTKNNPLAIVTLIGAVVALPFAGVRAVTWTVFLLAVLYRLLASTDKRWQTAIPFLIALWANLHGGFVIGLAYVAWMALVGRSRRLFIVLLISVVATFVNPYSANLYVEVWRTLSDTSLHTTIEEWQSWIVTIELSVLAGIWTATRIITKKKLVKAIVSFDTLLLLATISSVRNTPLFALFATATIVAALRHALTAVGGLDVLTARLYPIRRAVFVTVIAIMLVIGYTVVDSFSSAALQPETKYPETIASALQARPCSGHLFNSYNVGGYLIWRAPATKVYIDGRMPSWSYNGIKYMDDYVSIVKDDAVMKRQFQRLSITCVVFATDTPFVKRLEAQGWHQDVVDRSGYTLLRK